MIIGPNQHGIQGTTRRIASGIALASLAFGALAPGVAGASINLPPRLGAVGATPMHLAQRHRMKPANTLYYYSFPQDGHLGAGPDAGLTDLNGQLYGTTIGGGTFGCGTVFHINLNLTTETVPYNFCQLQPDGHGPGASLIKYGPWLYSTLDGGGNGVGNGDGGVFKTTLTGSPETFYPFDGVNEISSSAPVLHFQNKFWGESPQGGVSGAGAVWYLQGSTITTCYTFSGGDGQYPSNGLIEKGPFLYGATLGGGQNNLGTIFKIDPTKCGTPNALVWHYSFGSFPTDGSGPHALIKVGQLLYGATTGGGSYTSGSIFSIGAAGPSTYHQIYSFNPGAGDGTLPWAPLLVTGTSPKYLWGTTAWGGTGSCVNGQLTGCGTIFKYQLPYGPLTTQWNFHGYDGQNPYSQLALDANGLFYGTTYLGGAGGNGTVFGLFLCTGNQC